MILAGIFNRFNEIFGLFRILSAHQRDASRMFQIFVRFAGFFQDYCRNFQVSCDVSRIASGDLWDYED